MSKAWRIVTLLSSLEQTNIHLGIEERANLFTIIVRKTKSTGTVTGPGTKTVTETGPDSDGAETVTMTINGNGDDNGGKRAVQLLRVPFQLRPKVAILAKARPSPRGAPRLISLPEHRSIPIQFNQLKQFMRNTVTMRENCT